MGLQLSRFPWLGLQRKGINKMSDADAFRNLLLHLRPEAEEETGDFP